MTKKIISIFLISVMLLCALPFGVMGAEAEKSPSALDKWENNIDVINSVLKGNLVMAEGSPKFFSDASPVHYDESNKEVYPVLRGETFMLPIRAVAESLGMACNWDDALKKVTLTKGGKTSTMTLGSTNAEIGGKKATLSVAPELIGGRFFAPAEKIASAAGKKLCIDEGDINLIIIGENENPFNTREKRDLREEIARATYYERPDAERVLADFAKNPRANQHPRILITKDRVAEIKEQVKTDPFMMETYEFIKKKAEEYYKNPLPVYHDDYGINGERYWYEYIEHLMLVYWIDGKEEYLARSIEIALALSEFPHYGPYSSLAEAEAMYSLAIAYDWMYDYMTPEQKSIIKTALVEKRMKDDLLKYQAKHENSHLIMKGGWPTWGNNFTTHGNEGVIISIAALWDEERELCKEMLRYFFRSMETAFTEISPDGGGREGVGYLLGGTVSQSITSFRLLVELAGTDYNYLTAPQFKRALENVVNMYGSCGVYRYGDAAREESGYATFAWIGKYMSPMVYERRQRELRDYPETVLPVVSDLIDYDPDFVVESEDLDLGIMYRKLEAGSFRNSFNNYFNTFVGFKGGDSVMSHSHRDLGSFVFHTDGVPWFDDHGMIFYHYANKQGQVGAELYNHRAEGHNLMLFRSADDLNSYTEPDKNGMIPLDYLDMEDVPLGAVPEWETSIKDGGKLQVVEENGDKVLLFSTPSTGTGRAEFLYRFTDGLGTESFTAEYDIKINHMAGETGSVVVFYGLEGDTFNPKATATFAPIHDITPDSFGGFKYKKDKWYHVKTVFDIENSTYDMFVDGKQIQKDKPFIMPPDYSLYVFGFETGKADLEYMIDDVKISIANNEHNYESVPKNKRKSDDQVLSAVSKLQNFTNGEGAGFATADLGTVYPDYTKDYKRAFGLFNNREVLVIRDEATVEKDCETWWFGHTVTDITLSEDGKSAILTEADSGKRLWVGIVSDGPERFTTTIAEPFPESPSIRAEVLEGMFATRQKLTIMNNRKAGEKIALTVMMTPLYAGETVPSKLPQVKPIAEWEDEAYTGERLPDLLLDGVSFEGFDPNQRYYEVIYERYDIDPQKSPLPVVSVPEGVNAVIKQAEKVGDTATITVGQGENARTYYMHFGEEVEIFVDPENPPPFDIYLKDTGKILDAGDYTIKIDDTRRSWGFAPESSVFRIDYWFDGDTGSNHSVAPFEAFEDIDLGEVVPVSSLEMIFANGLQRQDIFSLYASVDGENWDLILSESRSSGKSRDWETFSFPTIQTRWLRIVSHGNSKGSQFCNLSELRIRK